MSDRNQILAFLQSGALLGLPSGKILMAWGTPKRTSFPQITAPHFYHSDFFLKQTYPWLYYPHWKEYTVQELMNLLTLTASQSVSWHMSYEELFLRTFAQLQQEFQQGQLEKAVPYVFEKSKQQMTQAQLQNCLIQGLRFFLEQSGYLYGYWDDHEGFLGFTPEVLFIHQVQENPLYLQTMALAGTCHASESLEMFQTDFKECEEHKIVVKGIQQALQPLGKVEIKERTVLKLPDLYHLVTPIHIHLTHPFQFESIVKQLHPTPALGAFPKINGWKWLLNYNQQLERKTFGAPFGIYYPALELSFCVIGIRQIQWNLDGMRIGAGCGVVKESCLEKEWQEIQLKLKTIHHLLAI